MERVNGENLHNYIHCLDDYTANIILNQCLNLIIKLRNVGLIHGDFNEFNIMIEFPPIEEFSYVFKENPTENDYVDYINKLNKYRNKFNNKYGYLNVDNKSPRVILIDFPQMISLFHDKAYEY